MELPVKYSHTGANVQASRRYNLIVALIALAGFTLVNVDSSFFTGAYLDVMKYLHLSEKDIGYIYTVSYTIGAILSLFIGAMADHLGRKRTFQIAMIGVAFGSLLSGVAWSLISLIIFRSLSQASSSAEPILGQTFVTEEVDPRRRGLWMAFQQEGYPLGWFIGSLLTWVLLPRIGWRWLFVVGFIPIVLCIFIARYLHEPPRFEQAKHSRQIHQRSAFRDLFAPEVRRTTISMSIYGFFVMVGLGSVQLWMPSLAQSHGVPVNSIAEINSIGTGIGILGYLFSGWLGDKVGRKYAGIYMIIPGILFALLLAKFGQSFESITLFYALWWFAYMGQFAGSMALAAESFPTEARGTGMGFVTFLIWLGVAVSGILSPLFAAHLGINGAYLVLGVIFPVGALVGLIIKKNVPPGQELIEIGD
ncbi:MAG: MFS transporter [Alicyclobacillus macrosporangiidus]|uniref:MFS transporter n=1 Tax=Alicyclobacillus macrosporangiidus TaxID=392015 RepID=UPI0026EF9852|nr:MFS transporter [Alicyclobacillus macrosporangiidus]MCL6597482.1 MFS transporter [Alicyclobacillus macrosporangiidus]